MKHKLKTLAIAATMAIFSVNNASANAVPYCREYTETFQIGGRTEQGYGTACLQPDGSWEKQGSNYNNPFELQKQNVVYVIDNRPVNIYRPGYRPYGYSYSQPTTFFSLSFNDGYRSRPNYYYHNRGYYHNHRGHGHGHGHDWKHRGDRGRGHSYGKKEWH